MSRLLRTLAPPSLLGLALLLSGCGKEMGRIKFSGEGTSSTTTALGAGEVALWTDIDMEWEGDATLEYQVDLLQGGANVATAVCSPIVRLATRVAWVETNLGAKHSRKGGGKMHCKATVPAAGPTTVNATLAFGKRPITVKIVKADLVLKQ